MQSKATTVKQYLAELPAERRAAIEAVRKVILANLDPTYEEGMQYGMIGYYVPHSVYPPGYHCDPSQPLPFVCLASQKNYMSVYLGSVYGQEEKSFREAWAKTGKRLDMGKCCVRFRKLEDLVLDLIGDSIRQLPARKFIDYYERVLRESLRSTRKRTPAKAKAAKSTKAKSRPTTTRPTKSKATKATAAKRSAR